MDVSRSEAARQSVYDDDTFKRYVAEKKQQQADEISQLEADHKKNLEMMSKEFKKQEDEANKDYRVELKRTVDVNEEKLSEVRKDYEEQIQSMKKENAKEFEKVSERQRKRIEAYKKNQDANLQKMHDHYVQTEAEMEQNYDG